MTLNQRIYTQASPICVIEGDYCTTHRGMHVAEVTRASGCPGWCVINHAGHLSDDTDDQVTHQAEPDDFGISVMRFDCPAEGRIGAPLLYVSVEVEITTWEEAGRLARALLAGVACLNGAEQ